MSEKMTTSEPTTGEIVRALRCDGDANNCVDCRYATYDTAMILCDQEQNVRDAADRLESQEEEKKISRYLIEMQSNVITELTARAEKAECERDAAIAACSGWCETCAFSGDCAKHDNNDSSAGFSWYTDCEDWEWRGQPQEGDSHDNTQAET